MEPSEMGHTTMSSNQVSQQLSSSNQPSQVDLLPMFPTPLAVSWGSQTRTGMQVPLPVQLGSYQLFSMGSQSIQHEPSYRIQAPTPNFVGLDQLSSSNRQLLGPQSSSTMQSFMSTNVPPQPLSSTNKRPTLIRAPSKVQSIMPIGMDSQLSSTNKRTAQLEPPQRVQSESFESVRSKLRESLAASLAMISDQQDKQQSSGKSTLGNASSTETKMATPVGDLNSNDKNSSSGKSAPETLVSGGSAFKFDEAQNLVSDMSSKENTTGSTDVEDLQPKDILLQEAPSNSAFVKDDLLQGHGLCWVSDLDAETVHDSVNHDNKRLKMTEENETAGKKDTTVQKAKDLAFRIEAELFKLFGGVNKKYKEKGRSLLFNLKDRNNPELRERVLSGEIAPERLCAMTAEELASKELSQWRLAKAEELAQMVVLPDSDLDLRRLVKKTHKGEFQVEVEQPESFPVEAELGPSVLSHVSSRTKEKVKARSKSKIKSEESKAAERSSSARKTDSGDQNLSSHLDILHEKTDLMQDLMVDELKDSEVLPPVVSLDEFMQALDSEPPFENLSVDSLTELPSSGVEKLEGLEPEKIHASDGMEHKQDAASVGLALKSDTSQDASLSKLGSSKEGMQSMLGFADVTSKDLATINPDKVDLKRLRNDDDLKSGSANIQSDACPPKVASTIDIIWEGLIQLNISTLATVIGFFRSGEKTSTQEWPSLIEIKGRVRLEAFEKFLKDLPLSRSRAIMIAQFCWKEGSSDSGRLNRQEIIDSYISEERVGYAEPAPGVELYLCPQHSRMTEMLDKCLPKGQTEALQAATAVDVAADGLIGVVIWRRPHEIISPKMSSHHKHGHSSSKKQHSSSRKQPTINSYPDTSRSSAPSAFNNNAQRPPPEEDDADGDVPPGFGPRDDDDLPEFDFAHGSALQNTKAVAPRRLGSGVPRPHVLSPPPARPVERIREMIHKYGQSENVKRQSSIVMHRVHPWNNDDEEDDIPEWQPPQDHHLPAQPLPTPPRLPPQQQQLHAYQQQSFNVNQQRQPPLPQQFVPMVVGVPPPQMAVMPGTLSMPQPRWMPPPVANVMQASNYIGQPSAMDGQVSSSLGVVQQNVMGWRPDVFRM